MNGKVIFTVCLLAIVSIPFAQSLKCLTCSDVKGCLKPVSVQCDQPNANATRDILARYYYDLNPLNTKDFSCFMGRYKAENITVLDVRGCIMTGAINCNSKLIDESLVKEKCTVCQKDKCNGNSVGTYSSSIGTMVLVFVLSKIFVN